MKCMRSGGILFFLDSAMDVHYKQMSSAAESLGNMAQIYSPRVEEFHTLSLDSVRRFFDLYKTHFGKFLCLTNCFVSSSAWHKTKTSSLERKSFCAKMDMEFLDNTSELHSLLLDKLQLEKSTTSSMSNLQDKSSDLDKVIKLLPDKMDKPLLDMTKMDNSELVGKLLMDRCSFFIQKDDLMWRKSQRHAVSRLTARMVQFRAKIGKLLVAEFEKVDIENEIFDEIDAPPDDVFDSLLTEYCHSVPEYFFQTKSKKKRIFTGLPVSI